MVNDYWSYNSSDRWMAHFLENAGEHLDGNPFIGNKLTFTAADLINCGQNPFNDLLGYATPDVMAC